MFVCVMLVDMGYVSRNCEDLDKRYNLCFLMVGLVWFNVFWLDVMFWYMF